MIGFELICLLREVNYTELSKELGVSKQCVDKWMRRESVSKKKVKEVAELLGVPESFLNAKVNTEKLESEIENFFE